MNFLRSIFRRRPKLEPCLIIVHLQIPTQPPGHGIHPAENYIGLNLLAFGLRQKLKTWGQFRGAQRPIGQLNNGSLVIEVKNIYAAFWLLKPALKQLGVLQYSELWYSSLYGWRCYYPDAPTSET